MSRPITIGDTVRIRQAFPPGHVRTPYFIRGKTGEVIRLLGDYAKCKSLPTATADR